MPYCSLAEAKMRPSSRLKLADIVHCVRELIDTVLVMLAGPATNEVDQLVGIQATWILCTRAFVILPCSLHAWLAAGLTGAAPAAVGDTITGTSAIGTIAAIGSNAASFREGTAAFTSSRGGLASLWHETGRPPRGKAGRPGELPGCGYYYDFVLSEIVNSESVAPVRSALLALQRATHATLQLIAGE